jgi:hypothetical protein
MKTEFNCQSDDYYSSTNNLSQGTSGSRVADQHNQMFATVAYKTKDGTFYSKWNDEIVLNMINERNSLNSDLDHFVGDAIFLSSNKFNSKSSFAQRTTESQPLSPKTATLKRVNSHSHLAQLLKEMQNDDEDDEPPP